MRKNILIISHVFPPSPGIGGRRWAKFSKYLTRKGYKVSVLCAENLNKNSASPWIDDVKNLEIQQLPFSYPEIVAYPRKGLVNKLMYFSSIFYLKTKDKGNYFDRTIFWQKQLENSISKLISDKNINCVIVSGAPFRQTYYVSLLKRKFKEVKIMVDFRDWWTEDSEISAFSALSTQRKMVEKEFEKATVNSADSVICVADSMKHYFAQLGKSSSVEVIPNGFDPDDFYGLDEKQNLNPEHLNLVFTGTLYINIDYILKPFFEAIAELRQKEPGIYNKLRITFIGEFPKNYLSIIKQLNIEQCFIIKGKMNLKEVYSHIKNSDYCLLFLNNVYNFALSTKFCEYISQHKKIMVVANKGEAADYIVKNQLGYWIRPDFAYKDLSFILKNHENKLNETWNPLIDVNDYSLDKLTDKLIEVIEK